MKEAALILAHAHYHIRTLIGARPARPAHLLRARLVDRCVFHPMRRLASNRLLSTTNRTAVSISLLIRDNVLNQRSSWTVSLSVSV